MSLELLCGLLGALLLFLALVWDCRQEGRQEPEADNLDDVPCHISDIRPGVYVGPCPRWRRLHPDQAAEYDRWRLLADR